MTDSVRHSVLYFMVGVASLIAAVYVSSIWLRPAHGSGSIQYFAQADTVPATEPPPPVPETETSGTDAATNQMSLDPATAFLEPYLYDTREGRRNPFKQSTFIEDGTFSNQLLGPSTPLERYELEELRLMAIMWDVKNPKAMFIDPAGEVHIVSKDDRIGRRRGYIAVIREGEVVVVESTMYGGEPVYSTRILRMER